MYSTLSLNFVLGLYCFRKAIYYYIIIIILSLSLVPKSTECYRDVNLILCQVFQSQHCVNSQLSSNPSYVHFSHTHTHVHLDQKCMVVLRIIFV